MSVRCLVCVCTMYNRDPTPNPSSDGGHPPRATVPSGIFAARPTDTDVFFRCGPSELDCFSSSSKLSVVKAAQGIYHCRPLLARCGGGGTEAAQLAPYNPPGRNADTRLFLFGYTQPTRAFPSTYVFIQYRWYNY